MCNRMLMVEISNKISDSLKIKFGVPQGSFLGHILFLIYINNTKIKMEFKLCLLSDQKKPNFLIYKLYADDTTLVMFKK